MTERTSKSAEHLSSDFREDAWRALDEVSPKTRHSSPAAVSDAEQLAKQVHDVLVPRISKVSFALAGLMPDLSDIASERVRTLMIELDSLIRDTRYVVVEAVSQEVTERPSACCA